MPCLENRPARQKPPMKDTKAVRTQLHIRWFQSEMIGKRRMLASARQKHQRAPKIRTGCSRSGVPRPLASMKLAEAIARRRVESRNEGRTVSAVKRHNMTRLIKANITLSNGGPASSGIIGAEYCFSISAFIVR